MSLFSLHDNRGPAAAVEMAGHRISGVRLDTRGGATAIAAHATEALSDGALVPALTVANVHTRAAVSRALARVLEALGRPRRIGLVLPDPVAKLSIVRFQQLPAKTHELEQLIRWQVKKSSPFPLEDAQVAYARATTAPDGHEFLVTVARRDVIAEYEALCDEAGVHAGLVDVSTPSVVNAVLAMRGARDRDSLIVNMARDWASLAVVRGGHVVLVRSRAADGDETLADMVHQTAMYYEDRLNGAGFSQVLLCGATAFDGPAGNGAAQAELVRRALEDRLGAAVTPVDPTSVAALTDRGTANVALLDALTPSIGLLMRYREAAA
jgi:type IV pilus assembly protein PilM